MAKTKPESNPKKSPAWKRLVKVGRDGASDKEPSREVEIVHPDGRHEKVSCFRAARLVTEGAAQPGAWTHDDLAAVDEADAIRKQRQVDTLRRDGLLVNDGAPNHTNPVPFTALRDFFGRFGR